MRRSSALYRDDSLFSLHATVSVAWSELSLHLPDGSYHPIELDGASHQVVDATFRSRFVRMIAIYGRTERTALITPPERGSIAPRVARLPAAPDDAVVLDAGTWETIRDWIESNGRLAGHTIDELARLAIIASAQFAVAIGEVAAQVANDLAGFIGGPLRSAGDVQAWLSPLTRAAQTSPRAHDALVAALAVCADSSAE